LLCGLVAEWVRPDAAAAADAAMAVVLIDDGPFTRNRVVQVAVATDGVAPGPVIEARVSNSPATVDGVLVDGQAIEGWTDWTLAAGADGPRTVYGQLRYEGGAWSAVGSTVVTLGTSPESSVYFDIDANGIHHDGTTTRPEPDWHALSRTPDQRIVAQAITPEVRDFTAFTIHASDWRLTFYHQDDSVPAGTYVAAGTHHHLPCESTCVVIASGHDQCSGAGPFLIHEVALTPEGDVDRLSADFRLDCSIHGVMAGSIRYGSDVDIVAVDQSPERLRFGTVTLGDPPIERSVTFEAIGPAAATFGQASLIDEPATDYSITGDDCSGTTLDTGETCSITVRFSATAREYRYARLVMPDNSARGGRQVRLFGDAVQSTSLSLSVVPPAVAPGRADVTVTVTPASAGFAVLALDGGMARGQPTTTELANPSRLELRYSVAVTPGMHRFEASLDGRNWHLPAEPKQVEVTIPDTGRPWGWVQIGSGASTDTRDVTVTAFVDLVDLPISTVALSNDGVNWTERTYHQAQQSWTLTAGGGVKTVYVKWLEQPTGYWSPVHSDTIVLETTPPTATAPTRALVGGTLSAGKAPVRIAWSGSDGGSGIASYKVRMQTDGGAWTTIESATTATSLTRHLAPGHTYRFGVRARDKAGNEGAYAFGSTFRVSGYQESSTRVRYAGTWGTGTSSAYWGGKAKSASAAGTKATFTFTGRSVAWVSLKAANRGKATVYVNGTKVATVDLYSATTKGHQVVWTRSWSTSATRTITIRVSGTAGRPKVPIDGFVVGS
jgi:hypothetical protein